MESTLQSLAVVRSMGHIACTHHCCNVHNSMDNLNIKGPRCPSTNLLRNHHTLPHKQCTHQHQRKFHQGSIRKFRRLKLCFACILCMFQHLNTLDTLYHNLCKFLSQHRRIDFLHRVDKCHQAVDRGHLHRESISVVLHILNPQLGTRSHITDNLIDMAHKCFPGVYLLTHR